MSDATSARCMRPTTVLPPTVSSPRGTVLQGAATRRARRGAASPKLKPRPASFLLQEREQNMKTKVGNG